jgi:tetratricopeptide (TPR) repeat protein
MITILTYSFINSLVFKKVILNAADFDRLNNKYSNAISRYNLAYMYYEFNHFSEANKNIYFDIPYEKALCYFSNNEQEKALQTMLNALNSIKKQYGASSKETAYFINKYLIEYYIITNNIPLAEKEFNNLLTLYNKIGIDKSIKFSLFALQGDLYYQQKDYTKAINYYINAYQMINAIRDIDYDILVKISNRIAAYEINNKNFNNALKIYTEILDILKNAPNKNAYLIADVLINLGNLYKIDKQYLKQAIKCYEEAATIIDKNYDANYLKVNINNYLSTLSDLYKNDGQFNKAAQIKFK